MIGKHRRRGFLTAGVLVLVMGVPAYTGTSIAASGDIWIATGAVPPQRQVDVDVFADGTAFAYARGEKMLLRSGNAGLSWMPLSAVSFTNQTKLRFATPEIGFAVTARELLKTSDSGESWEVVARSEFRGLRIDALGVSRDANPTLLVGGHPYRRRTGCPIPPRITTLAGASNESMTWKRATLPYFGLVREISFATDRDAAVLVDEMSVTQEHDCGYDATAIRSHLYTTQDAGRTFRRVLSAPFSAPITAIAHVTDRVVIAGTSEGVLFLSDEEGKSVQRASLGRGPDGERVAVPIHAIDFEDSDIGFAATNGAGIWTTTDGGFTWTEERSPNGVAGVGWIGISAAGGHAVVGGPSFLATRR